MYRYKDEISKEIGLHELIKKNHQSFSKNTNK